jgi:DNA invertase Pin-like site-specific DNA recombinase
MARPKASKPNPKTAIAYIRVSTDEQALGPEAQRADIERWSAASGARVLGWHVDHGVSGGAELDKRPALMAALSALRSQRAGLLIVAKRDRLARDVVVAGLLDREVARMGARITSADGASEMVGPEGALMRGIIDIFAQYERGLIRSRTKAALAAKSARNECVGEVPLGAQVSADGIHLEPCAAEIHALAKIKALRARGLSMRAIVERLNADNVPSRAGKWHLTTVARVLSRPSE